MIDENKLLDELEEIATEQVDANDDELVRKIIDIVEEQASLPEREEIPEQVYDDGWISAERTPFKTGRYLVTRKKESSKAYVRIARYNEDTQWKEKDIIAWQPLPRVYKEAFRKIEL